MRQVVKVMVVALLAWGLGLGLFLADLYRVLGDLSGNVVRVMLSEAAVVLLLSLLISTPVLWFAGRSPQDRKLTLHLVLAVCVGLLPSAALTASRVLDPQSHLTAVQVIRSFGTFFVIVVVMCLFFGWWFLRVTRPANPRMQASAGASGGA